MFHCKGNEPENNIDVTKLSKCKSMKDIINDEWVLEYMEIQLLERWNDWVFKGG